MERAGSGERGAVCSRPSIRYPPTPAATTTSPIRAGARDRRGAAGGPVVGAPLISGGAAAGARERGRGRPLDPGGEGTGFVRPTGGAPAFLPGERWVGFLGPGRR